MSMTTRFGIDQGVDAHIDGIAQLEGKPGPLRGLVQLDSDHDRERRWLALQHLLGEKSADWIVTGQPVAASSRAKAAEASVSAAARHTANRLTILIFCPPCGNTELSESNLNCEPNLAVGQFRVEGLNTSLANSL